VPVPMLLLMGEVDRVMPPDICNRLAERSPGGERVLSIRYGGAGHGFDAPPPSAAPSLAFWRVAPAASANRFDPHVRDAAWADIKLFFDVTD